MTLFLPGPYNDELKVNPLCMLILSECRTDTRAVYMRVEYTKGERASRELIMLQRQSSEAAAGRKMKEMVFRPTGFPEPYLSLPPHRRPPPSRAPGRSKRHQSRDVGLVLQRRLSQEGLAQGTATARSPEEVGQEAGVGRLGAGFQLQLCEVSRQRIDELIKKAEQAKAIIRGEIFYEIDQLEWAIQVFREVTAVISLVYAPARICMPPMETNLSYKVFVSSEVIEAVNDTQVNIYRDVFEQLVKPAIEAEQPGCDRHLDRVAAADVLLHDVCALIKQHFPTFM
ncbi:MAG: hypothetical protein MRJ92_14615 [Nitrospira sp.]|nr:hypothetical protein [Nitrospira sp.]